jgi:2OG-Fe(II) oxygenase superfamily
MSGLPQHPPQHPVEVIYDRESIAIYRGLDGALCRSIIELFDQDVGKRRGRVSRSETGVAQDDNIKNSWDLEIRNEGLWQPIFAAIHPKIGACLSHYLSRSPVLQSFALEATGYKIQMYPRNEGHFRWHADAVGANTESRQVAMILYLNDVTTGGETEFFHQGIQIKPKAGLLMLSPASWNYMHRGLTPESGDKYIIQTFIRIKGR